MICYLFDIGGTANAGKLDAGSLWAALSGYPASTIDGRNVLGRLSFIGSIDMALVSIGRFDLLIGNVLNTGILGQAEKGPYARIAILRPNDGKTVDFEAGYIRHLELHRQAKDPWGWYGWTIWAGERQRWFVYATFAHSAASLDGPVAPAEDERDNILNVVPHAEFKGNALYEYLPVLSRGTGVSISQFPRTN